MTTHAPLTTTQGNTQSQPGHRSWPGDPDPAEMAAKYRSSGWRRDLEHVLKVYYKHTVQTPFREAEWARARELFFDRLTPRKAEAVAIKEESPLNYMPYIAEEFHRATGLCRPQSSPSGLNEGATSTGCLSKEARSRSAPI